MAKEFDAYLRKHLTECDLYVYSIPYRNGISATNRLILNAALESYTLWKMAAVQMGSELTAHIDEMIKLCIERLRMDTEITASVGFEKRAICVMDNHPLVIDAPSFTVVKRVIQEAEDGIAITAAPLVTWVGTSLGRSHLSLLADADVTGTLKSSLLDPTASVILEASIAQTNKTGFIEADAPVPVGSSLQSLCYQMTFDAAASVEIAALLLGSDVYYSLGTWYSGLAAGASISGTQTQKHEAAASIVTIMQEANGSLIKVLYPDDADTVVNAQIQGVDIWRYRTLEDMDDGTLDSYDDMTLEELDFIIS